LSSDGVGRTGTYILLDIVLNRICKGAREINIAATLEHIRDQRAKMVKTKVRQKKFFTSNYGLFSRINLNLSSLLLPKK
jgi:protein tyrosine phosphatase